MLNKNLNFCPTPNVYNKYNLQKDLKRFFRAIKLKSHFGDDNTNKIINKFERTSNSSWTPNNVHHSVTTFISLVQNEIDKCHNEIKPLPKSNLTKKEREALHTLKTKNDIVITKADKGGAVVIMDVEDYINEANSQLQKTENYREVDRDLTSEHELIINNTIKQFRNSNLLEPKVADNLITNNSRTPRFYTLPKIHKVTKPSKKTKIPGRPVISSVECHSSKISEFVDYHLQPFVQQLKSYVKDTSDYVRKINNIGNVPKNCYLVSMDVRALYTNIPHDEGVSSVQHTLLKNKKIHTTSVIVKFLQLILTLNNFVFNGKHYIQTKGCAMGTKCAPSYANIFMGYFEEKFIYPLIAHLSSFYVRYIDDVFLIWTGSIEQFEQFIQDLNKKHPTIKFDYQISKKEVTFLDTVTFIDSDGKIKTKLYVKPTDRKSYLHYNSEHPKSTKNSIPYSQALRAKRICTNDIDYKVACNNLQKTFIKRGYSHDLVNSQIKKASDKSREEVLQESAKRTQNRIPLVTTYNRTLPNLMGIIHKHWHVLQSDARMEKLFTDYPLLAFKRNKNLNDMIGSNKINNNQVARRTGKTVNGKCSPCNTKGALCCKLVRDSNNVTGINNKNYLIRDSSNCKSKDIIYLQECIKCMKPLYVGKSEYPTHQRINKHRFDSKEPNSLPIDQHFYAPDHNFDEHARFTIIETFKCATMDKHRKRKILLQRENFWIRALGTIHPFGLNMFYNKI